MTALNRVNDPMSHFAERETRQFRLIFGLSVVVFLIVGAVARLLPRSLRPWPAGRRSLFAEAKAVANRFIPFAFMG